MGFAIGSTRVIPGHAQKRVYARLRRAMGVSPESIATTVPEVTRTVRRREFCGYGFRGPAFGRSRMTERLLRILIVGAGIGGLTAALALLREGHDVEVYEQAPTLVELGAGVQISANGSRVLFALGLEDAIRRVWCEPAGKEIRLWNTGETWRLFDLGAESVVRYGAPYFMTHRADLHQTLIDAVRALATNAIHLNARCASYDDDGHAVM